MIDLSKAYKGQIVTLRNGEEYQIGKVINNDLFYNVVNSTWSDIFAYLVDGTSADSIPETDIVKIEDSIQVQVARLEGELKGLESAIDIASDLELVMGSQTYDVLYSKLSAKIDELKAEILILTVETY